MSEAWSLPTTELLIDRAGECNAAPIPLVAEREVAEAFEFIFGKPERGFDWMDMV